jgi:hypothetical protein
MPFLENQILFIKCVSVFKTLLGIHFSADKRQRSQTGLFKF